MADKLVRLTADQRNNFVAYLDGELDEQQTRDIEQLLTYNEVARHDVESLAAAWELLDELPRPRASEEFSQKTIATLKLEGRQPQLQDQTWYLETRRYGGLFLGWLVVLACGMVGFLAARTLPPAEADQLIQNYPLLKNLDSYQEIGSAEFLEKLQRSTEWARRNAPVTEGAGR